MTGEQKWPSSRCDEHRRASPHLCGSWAELSTLDSSEDRLRYAAAIERARFTG